MNGTLLEVALIWYPAVNALQNFNSYLIQLNSGLAGGLKTGRSQQVEGGPGWDQCCVLWWALLGTNFHAPPFEPPRQWTCGKGWNLWLTAKGLGLGWPSGLICACLFLAWQIVGACFPSFDTWTVLATSAAITATVLTHLVGSGLCCKNCQRSRSSNQNVLGSM